MNIYVKYCGGCNPRYDREALVSRLREELKEHTFSEKYEDPDVSLIVCGCACACADKSDSAAPYGIITVWQPLSADRIREQLDHIATEN